MATIFYPTSAAATVSGASNWTNGPSLNLLSLTRGSGVVTDTRNTIASLNTTWGNLSNVEALGSNSTQSPTGTPVGSTTNWAAGTLIFLTKPLNAVTISAQPTFNLRGSESNAMANYGLGGLVFRLTPGGAWNASLVRMDPGGVELGTSEAVTAVSPTTLTLPTTLAAGEVLGMIWGFAGVGTSASGFTAAGYYNGTTSAASGDSFVTFSETITEQSTARVPRNSAINHQNPAVLMEGMEQDKRNHLWLPRRKLWRPRIEVPTPVFV